MSLITAISLVITIVTAIVAAVVGYIARQKIVDSKVDSKLSELKKAELKIENAGNEAENIRTAALKEIEVMKKEAQIKVKEETYKIKEEAEKEIKASKNEIQQKEQRLMKKEENIDKKLEKIEEKEKELEEKGQDFIRREEEVEDIKKAQERELERISGLSKVEAKDMLLENLKGELVHESAIIIRDHENKLEEEKERTAKKVISTAIAKAASDYVVETTVSVVQLPNDEMKGRIIGREGRNIRSIEAMTGVDVIIDDTPEAVVISSFDPVKREVAKLAIEKLVSDGRIHPAKIEESIEKSKKEVDALILESGEQAILELGITNINQDLLKILGRLRYRTSYGQNVLMHSIEVGHLAGVLAAEIGADVETAKRGGLLHDIGKALDHDIEGSHALIGAEFLKKFKENPLVINCAASHHGEEEFESVEAVLVQAADAISASRPGARRETLATYLKRLEGLEKIANEFDGVERSFAIQAGREIRIVVKPEEIDDDKSLTLARDVSKQIEATMQYPGQIKVTVIRETRAVEYAK